jgi:pyruvate dehydrogenase E2 component (dihydrolipoamide acetyltransferase)
MNKDGDKSMSAVIELKVPDIGDFESVEVIELLVKPGDSIRLEQSLITVESDKASMEIPASAAGVVRALRVKVGDKVAEGSVVLELEISEAVAAVVPSGPAAAPAAAVEAPVSAPAAQVAQVAPVAPVAPVASTAPASALEPHVPAASDAVNQPHASPSVRMLARELGVDLHRVTGSGPKARITPDDVRAYVKQAVALSLGMSVPDRHGGSAGVGVTGAGAIPLSAFGGRELAAWPKIDFAKFGEVEAKPLSRIKKLSGANLHRNWVAIPHVTNHDEADITDLENFRNILNKENEKRGIKITMLAFLIHACVAALKKFPEFNASLDGDQLILKRYFHIGFAADTPNGLVVPVVRDADRKGVLEIAQETSALAAKARDGKLSPTEMQGGCFSISSLGGIGGTYFTPIINAPEVAILGVCKSQIRPVWDGKQFAPRLILPLSLSWDHRVIDGAAAARFNAYLGQLLADFRRTLL